MLLFALTKTLFFSIPLPNPISFLDITITADCTSEEAEQSLIRHALHCVSTCYSYKIIVDTDVLVLLISYISQHVQLINDIDIYAELVNLSKIYDIKRIVEELGLEVCKALPFIYALTACDITSSFYGKGKSKAWDTWMKSEMRDTFTDLFCRLGRTPVNLCKNDFNLVGNFIIEMYSNTGKRTSLTTLRVETFKSFDNDLRKLPPSSEALF